MLDINGKAMGDQRRSLPAWGSAVVLLILLESALWPSMSSMPSLDDYLQELPPALGEMFAIDEMSTGRGFLNAEIFTLMLPMMLIVYGISHGARMVAGEEEAGTLDLLLVTPLSAAGLLVEEVLALTEGIAVLGLCAFGATEVGSVLFGLDVGVAAAAAGSLSVALLGLELGVVALVVGAVTGRRGVAVATASGAALGGYVLYVAGMFVDGFSTAQRISPFHQALHAGPLAPELSWSLAWLVVVPALLVAVAVPTWSRRDIGVHA